MALPPKVFVKRVAKRVLGKKSSTTSVLLEPEPKINYLDFSKIKIDSTRSSDFVSNKYLNGQADFLGTGWVLFKGTWQKDFRSGFCWDETLPSKDQLSLGLDKNDADVKVPWEFGRMHQLLRASFCSKENTQDYIKTVLQDFRLNNKIGFGVHWMNAMEVAIRAINLCVAFNKVGYSEKEDLVFLQAHFSFILQNLERKEGLGNNHYLANLTGLLFGFVYFPDWSEFQEKRSWILKEFCAEIEKQFYKDGGNFEGSTYYHSLSTEIASLGLACLVNLDEIEAIKKVQKKISKALYFLKSIAKPNAELPQFGDNDSGRILPFSVSGDWSTPKEREDKYSNLSGYSIGKTDEKDFVENVLNVSGVAQMGNALFGEKGQGIEYDFVKALIDNKNLQIQPELHSPELDEDLGLALPEHKTWTIEISSINIKNIEPIYFKEFGIVVLKSEEFYLSMSLLERDKAHRYRGHFHNDQLSLDLWVKGEQLLSDPGNITYTGEMDVRNAMRSAEAHNAPYLDEEPNRYMEGITGLFHTMNDTNTELYEFSKQKIKGAVFFKNEKIVREIFIEENKITIQDSASKPFEVNTNNGLKSDGYGRRLRE